MDHSKQAQEAAGTIPLGAAVPFLRLLAALLPESIVLSTDIRIPRERNSIRFTATLRATRDQLGSTTRDKQY
jgi:hypothetical protein